MGNYRFKMPNTFTSYWGSSIHGMEIKWTNDPNAATSTLTAEITSNYYWRMQLYYNGAANDPDLEIRESIGGTSFATDMQSSIPSPGGTSVYHGNISSRDKFKVQFLMTNP